MISHLHHCDGLRRTGTEHEAKVSCCGHQSTLVWRLSLVEELPCEDIMRMERVTTAIGRYGKLPHYQVSPSLSTVYNMVQLLLICFYFLCGRRHSS